jgi:hypothetical protein
MDFKAIKALPLLVIWGVWLARNSIIFNEKPMVLERTATHSLAILSSFPQESGTVKIRNIQEEEIDITRPWGFFDGASQNNRCGGGAILFLSESHFFSMTFGLGEGTNNFAEQMSLKLLIAFAIEKGCRTLLFLVIL